MPTVTFLDRGKPIQVESDCTVLCAAQQLGLELAAPCGGNGTCGKCRVKIDGKEVLACRTQVTGDMTVQLPGRTETNILTFGQTTDLVVDPIQPGYLLAFDIGTTTVVCYLLSPDGRELAVESMLNPQASYGADVISRIQCALTGAEDSLTQAIRGGMSQLIAKCCDTAGIGASEIAVISVVGNPCMQQLFLGISPANLATVPFEPVLISAATEPAETVFPECGNAVLLTVPDISGYVGADTVACVLASKLYEAEQTTLMVDIGTNGEIALGNRERIVCCSAAAGPAFEGAHIRFGSGAVEGAISSVQLNDDGSVLLQTIGDAKPTSICGSGLVDAFA